MKYFYALRTSPTGPQFGDESTPHSNKQAPRSELPRPRPTAANHVDAQNQVHPGAPWPTGMRIRMPGICAHKQSNELRQTAQRLSSPKQNRRSEAKWGCPSLAIFLPAKRPSPRTRGHKKNPEETRCIVMIASLSYSVYCRCYRP